MSLLLTHSDSNIFAPHLLYYSGEQFADFEQAAYTCAGVSPLLIDSIIIHEEEHMSASVMSGEVTIAKVIPSRSRGNHYFVTGATA